MNYNCEFGKWFQDFCFMAVGMGMEMFYNQVFVDIGFSNDKVVDVEVVIVFGIGDCIVEYFENIVSDMFV